MCDQSFNRDETLSITYAFAKRRRVRPTALTKSRIFFQTYPTLIESI